MLEVLKRGVGGVSWIAGLHVYLLDYSIYCAWLCYVQSSVFVVCDGPT